MGDRGNIAVKQSNGNFVYLYTHWSGYKIEEVTAHALAKGWRWNDPSYLARIIFDELTKGQQGEETGFGISTEVMDNEHPIVYVDCDTQTVSVAGESYSFQDYIDDKLLLTST